MKQYFLVFLSTFLFYPTFANAQTYSEVWFENSTLPVRYSNSQVSYSGNSWIKNIKRQLPVSDSIFFTPKNALELNYISSKGGEWEANILYPRASAFQLDQDYTLNFKLYIQSETSLGELPAIEIISYPAHPDSTLFSSSKIFLDKFIKKAELNKWISVEIPLKKVNLDNLEEGIETIRFSQNSFDDKEHSLFIDQIEFLPSSFSQSQLTSAAVLSSAMGYERHIDLTWKLPLTPSIRYIKFYRSIDNKTFEPVAIRPIFAKKYSDIIPLTDTTYYYKISWMDYYYRESPLSNVLKVKSSKMDDSALVAMLQKANVSYFIDGEEFNSGMQVKNIHNQNSVVSVKNTGVGILTLIASIKDDFQLREKVLARLEKIVTFLEKADSNYGVFPELLDGRTGKVVYRDTSNIDSVNLVVDLESTGMLIQALLVSKQYFNQNNDAETELRNNISTLWKSVKWNQFLNSENYLSNKPSSEEGINEGIPLSGLSKMYLYILALASPENNIEIDSYRNALTKPLKARERKISHQDSLLLEENPEELTSIMHYKGNDYYEVPFINGQVYYGIPLAIGNKDDDLSDLLMGYITLDLKDIQDEYANYYQNTKNLINIQHRQSLEEGEAFVGDKLETSKGVAIYPFNRRLALENIKNYYLNHTESLWTEYGFARAVDFKQNRVVHPKEGVENGLIAVMIENGKSGLVWKLFMQDPGINNVVKVLFKK